MKYGYSVRDLSNQSYPEIRDLTIKIEALGFESIHITDHFFSSFDSREKKTPFLESITLLSALAIETERIKLGHVVLSGLSS